MNALLGLALMLGTVGTYPEKAIADEPVLREGIVISAEGGKFTMKDLENNTLAFVVTPSVVINVNGKPARLEDLKKGMKVRAMVNTKGELLSIGTIDDDKSSATPRFFGMR